MSEKIECPSCKVIIDYDGFGIKCPHCGFIGKGGSGQRPPTS